MSARKSKPTTSAASEHDSKRTKRVSPSEIKTWKDFHDNYINHNISPVKHTFTCSSGWNSKDGKEKIKEWLRVVAADQVRMYGSIQRNSEAALYPLIITTLLPVFDLCDCVASAKVVGEHEYDDLERAATEIAASQSRKTSRNVSTEQEGPSTETGETSATSNPPNLSSGTDDLPDMVNTAVEEDVMKFMVFVEKWLKSEEYGTSGRVEILIKDLIAQITRAIVEAKTKISNNEPDNAGFYQCCAYMALEDIQFGIFTDHKSFQFIRMDSSRILHYSKLFDLMQSEYDSFHATAVSVYAHLFEVMGVPRSTDLLASAAASAAKWNERAAALVADL